MKTDQSVNKLQAKPVCCSCSCSNSDADSAAAAYNLDDVYCTLALQQQPAAKKQQSRSATQNRTTAKASEQTDWTNVRTETKRWARALAARSLANFSPTPNLPPPLCSNADRVRASVCWRVAAETATEQSAAQSCECSTKSSRGWWQT